MHIIFRWLLRPLIVLVVLLSFFVGLLYYLVSRSLPDYAASYDVSGISSSVEIIRTDFNIPHIIGATNSDTYFGLGFVHAQDRLWQMMILKRYSQGRLSEVFGEATIKIDELMLRYDIYGTASQSLSYQNLETIEALEAYANGVNAWLDIIAENGLGYGAPERLIFPVTLERWTPVDSLAIANLQSVSIAGHLSKEVLGQKILNKLGPEALKDLNPELLPEYWESLQSGFASSLKLPRELDSYRVDNADLSHPLNFNSSGSNAWVIAPDKTVSGKTLLANDPHLDLSTPSIWYLARLELSTGGVIGATIPGMPVVIMGRSNHLAWGITSSHADVQDLYYEKLDPSNSNRYLTHSGYKNFELKVATIRVKGRDNPETIQLIRTENGPVIPGEFFNLNEITPRDHSISLAWTLFNPDNQTMSGGHNLMTATNLSEGLDALTLIGSPSVNVFITDGENIAYKLTGSIPMRTPFHQTQGRIPSEGWKYRNQWIGMMDKETLPKVINPASNYIANTNNMPTEKEFPYHFSFAWGDTKRIERLTYILEDRSIHSKESSVQAQTDIISESARRLIPHFANKLWHTVSSNSNDPVEVRKSQALELLKDWIGDMDGDKPQPLIFAQWANTIFRLLVQDELGSIYHEYTRPNIEFLERVFTDFNGASRWCDIVQTIEIEDCDTIANLALKDALNQLASQYGDDINTWRWGQAHEVRHEHQALGSQAFFSWLVNLSNFGSGGDNSLLRTSNDGTGENPFISTHGPSYRGIYDFSDPDGSLFIIPTGQSGHPLSKHYDDMNSIFFQNKYIPMHMNLELVKANSIGTNILKPKF